LDVLAAPSGKNHLTRLIIAQSTRTGWHIECGSHYAKWLIFNPGTVSDYHARRQHDFSCCHAEAIL
jgi:hypothetical protein